MKSAMGFLTAATFKYTLRAGITAAAGTRLAQVGGQAVLGRQDASPTPWLTERHGYDPTS